MQGRIQWRRQFVWQAAAGMAGLLMAGVMVASPVADEGKLPKGFRDPTLTLDELEIRQVDYPFADVLAHVTIDNPNQALTLTKLTYRIWLNGVECGMGQYPQKLTLPKKAPLALTLPISTDLSAAPHLGLNTLLQTRLGEKIFINYAVEVAFEVSVLWLFKRQLKARLTGRLPLRDILGKLKLSLGACPNLPPAGGMQCGSSFNV